VIINKEKQTILEDLYAWVIVNSFLYILSKSICVNMQGLFIFGNA